MTPDRPQRPDAWDYGSLAIISAAVLAYEIILLRVFSFSHWHHFASLAVSVALLGFGAAGTALSLLGQRAVAWGDRLYVGGMLFAALGMAGAFLLTLFMLVRPLFVVWELDELSKLLLLDFVTFLPFFGAAICMGQVFMRWPSATRELYAANLLGSGAGSLGAALLLASLPLESALLLLPIGLALASCFVAYRRQGAASIFGVSCLAVALALAGWIATAGVPDLPISDFKRLSYLLDLPDARVLREDPGLREKVTEVRSDSIRVAPGLSLNWMQSIPSQDALVLGSDRAIPLPRPAEEGGPGPGDFLSAMLGSVPFELRAGGRFALLGTSDWQGLRLASHHDASEIVWVEPNPEIVRAFKRRSLIDEVLIDTRTEGFRHFLGAAGEKFDLIFLEEAAGGGDAATEEYLLTVPAFREAMNRLRADGIVAVPLSLYNPPRYAPKLLRMLEATLRAEGVSDPGKHVAFLRSLQVGLVLFGPTPLASDDISMLRQFADRWGFDLAWLPGLTVEEANKFNRLESPLYFEAARAIFSDGLELPEDAAWYFDEPATDARPYFWRSVRWDRLPALLGHLGRQGLMFLDWSLLMLVATLVAAAVLAFLLILVPLGRLPKGVERRRSSVLLYFLSLGFGFLLLEMAVFQRAILFVGHPVLAASVIFATFLVGSGLGSLTAPKEAHPRTVGIVFGTVFALLTLAALVYWANPALAWSLPPPLRFALLILGTLPLAWAVGRPFPWGLRQLERQPAFIPWAWGVNGFASVIAGPLAALLSIHMSQPATWLAGGAFYLLAWSVARSWTSQLQP